MNMRRSPMLISILVSILLYSTTSVSAIKEAAPGAPLPGLPDHSFRVAVPISVAQRISFDANRDGNSEIYVMNADGSNQTRLTNNPANDGGSSWSPDGTHIAFESNRDGNANVYIMNSDGSSQTRLTTNVAADGAPAWSPDGTRIAFNSTRDGNSEIYVMNADGSNQTRLTTNLAGDYAPVWSPDGAHIAFHSYRDGNFEIYAMNADGSNQIRLTTTTANNGSAAWSPDGTRIAFDSTRDGSSEIYVMNADGSNPKRLTTNGAGNYQPDWSPDGARIVFNTYRDGNFEIYVMNADGTNQTRLTTDPAGDYTPAWSRGSGSPNTDLNWITRAAMPTARGNLGVVAASNGKIYAIGGFNFTTLSSLATVEEYDPATNTWRSRTPMPTARGFLGVAAASNGKIYAIGGSTTSGNQIATVEEYDPAANTWRSRASMPTARTNLGVAAASNGKLYAIGGAGAGSGELSTVEEYDPATNTWRSRARMPTPRNYLGVAAASNGKLYTIGGYRPSSQAHVATVEEYDPATNTWQSRASMPTARTSLGVAAGSNGKLYAIGGSIPSNYTLATVEEYDPVTNAWRSRAPMLTGRTRLGVAATSNGKLYAIGGEGSGALPLATVEEATLPISPTPPGPQPFLDLPFDYGGSVAEFSKALQDSDDGGRVTSWFDHKYPDYGKDNGTGLWLYNGRYTDESLKRWVGGTVLCYSKYCYDGHSGIDLTYRDPIPGGNADDLPVRAAASGKVVLIKTDCTIGDYQCGGGYGNYVLVYHDIGYFTRYGHLASVSVTTNTPVQSGDVLGIMGTTGRSTGVHLHFGVYRDNGNGQWDCQNVSEASCADKPTDPFGWRLTQNDQPVPDPWVADKQGPTSYWLWKYNPASDQTVIGSQGKTMTDATNSVVVKIAPNAFVGQATLQLSPEPVAGASAQLRQPGRSFWLRVLQLLPAQSSTESTTVEPGAAEFMFTLPVTITVSYTDADVLHLNTVQLRLYQWDEGSSNWQPLPSIVNTANRTVTATTTKPGSFSLQAPLSCPADLSEPDDNLYTANLLPADGVSVQHAFDQATDEDWIRVDTFAGGKYTVQTSALAAGVDTVLQVYGLDGRTPLARDDNGGGGKASRVEWMASASAAYLVRVDVAPGSALGCGANYSISATQKLNLYVPVIRR